MTQEGKHPIPAVQHPAPTYPSPTLLLVLSVDMGK